MVAGLLLLFALSALTPSPVCRDGWRSPSIGIQGACSHHGGVKRSILPLLVLVASVGAGTYLAKRISKTIWGTREVGKDKNEERTINKSAKPTNPIRTPYGTLQEYEAHLRKMGISDEQIQIELDKYQ